MSPPSNDTLLIDGPTPGNPFGFKLTPATSSTEDSQIYGEEVIQWLIYVKVSVYVWCECTYNNTYTYYIYTYVYVVCCVYRSKCKYLRHLHTSNTR